MEEEIFGPVLTIFVYEDAREAEALDLLDAHQPLRAHGRRLRRGSPGGAAHRGPPAPRRGQLLHQRQAHRAPSWASSPSAAARASGTNDKAGSVLNLLRWVSARAIKENLLPPTDYRYGFLKEP